MRYQTIPFFVFFLAITTLLQAQDYKDTLQTKLTALSKQTSLPGYAVGIVTKDNILFQQGYGWADRKTNQPFTPNTIQNIGSVSKTFIGVAIMQLVEAGKLTLDTKINDLLPFKINHPQYPQTAITVRHLATHTSGIKDTPNYNKKCYVLIDGLPEDLSTLSRADRKFFKPLQKNTQRPLGDFLKDYLVPGEKLYKKKNYTNDAPGAIYEYSNIGSALAALVVEKASGQPYDQYIIQHIMQPLNMTASGWKFDEVDMEQHATLYLGNDAPVPPYTLVTYPDGGVLSSSQDLCHYLQAMLSGYYHENDFLTAPSFDQLFTPTVKDGKESGGIFWSIDKHGKVGHAGGDPGIFTYIQLDPKLGYGVVFVTNCLVDQREDQFIDFVKVWKTLWRYGGKL